MSSNKQANRQNTLIREGITAVHGPYGAGRGSSKRAGSITTPPLEPILLQDVYLPQSKWIASGDSWFQITPLESGSATRRGLHNVLESVSAQAFACIYEPKTQQCVDATLSINPSYDLEVSAKLMRNINQPVKQTLMSNFQIIFAFKSTLDYMALVCDWMQNRWYVARVFNSYEYEMAEWRETEIKPNTFYSILIQIRDYNLSIDINGVPMFTNIRTQDGSKLNGYPGLKVKGTVFAIKDWRIKRGEAVGRLSGRSSGGGTAIPLITQALASTNSLHHLQQQQQGVQEDRESRELDLEDGASDSYNNSNDNSNSNNTYYNDSSSNGYYDSNSNHTYSGRSNNSNINNDISSITRDLGELDIERDTRLQPNNNIYTTKPNNNSSNNSNNSNNNNPNQISYSLASSSSSQNNSGNSKIRALSDYINSNNGSSNANNNGSNQSIISSSIARNVQSNYVTSEINNDNNPNPNSRSNYLPTNQPMNSSINSSQFLYSNSNSNNNPNLNRSQGVPVSSNNVSGVEFNRLGKPPVMWGNGGGPSKPTGKMTGSAASGGVGGGSTGGVGGSVFSFDDTGSNNVTATPQQQSVGPPVDRSRQQKIDYLKSRQDAAIVDCILRDIIETTGAVSFDQIAALDVAKRLLNEAVVLPLVMPELFVGIREPWRGVLLFGPPGSGKTLLAKAVCDKNCATFFNCSASTLISKYRGESEKIVRCLFEAARLFSPSIIFLDEIDSVMSTRGADSEHEASRRLKTELFAQLDGLNSKSNSNQGVMLLATTNCPWDLDEAIRRRLEKRIYIPLPDTTARQEIFEIFTKEIAMADDVDLTALALLSDGYSGSDIHILCREASMMPIRRMMASMSPAEMLQRKQSLPSGYLPPLTMDDFMVALDNTKASVSQASLAKFVAWDVEFGNH